MPFFSFYLRRRRVGRDHDPQKVPDDRKAGRVERGLRVRRICVR